MPSGIKIGDHVYLPVARLKGESEGGTALRKYTVEDTKADGRSIRVTIKAGAISNWIGTSAAHKVAEVGVYIIRIGDMETEDDLLDPLFKSVVQYCRLLLPEDSVRGIRVRSRDELRALWLKDGPVYGHVVIIGHGRDDGIKFGVDGWQSPEMLGTLFDIPEGAPKTFLSLCCRTGRKAFASGFSRFTSCACLIAPFHSVHGAVASQVCQTFLAHRFLEGKTTKVAFTQTQQRIPGSTIFRMWRQGIFL